MGGGPWRMALRLAAVLLFASTAGAQTPVAGGPAPDPSTAPAAAAEAAPGPAADFAGIVTSLRDASFPDKESAVERLAALGHPNTRAVLAALLEDRLLVRAPQSLIAVVPATEKNRRVALPPPGVP